MVVNDDIDRLLTEPAPESSVRLPDTDVPELVEGRAYLRCLAQKGWGVPTWPRRYGGCDATESEAADIRAILSRRSAPDLYPFLIGTNMAGPAVLAHGTESQQDRWLPGIAIGDLIVCQMFSEPDAGSDVANLATQAVRQDRDWRLRGQKVWTSRAAYADLGLCLARTDPEAWKHRGLTAFMIDMRDPGVTIRPIVQMDREAHFSEVYLEDVRVRDEDRLGAVGEGWKVAMTVLANERAGIAAMWSGSVSSAPPPWLQRLAAEGRLDDPILRDRAMGALIRERVRDFVALRVASTGRPGKTPGPEGSCGKLLVVAAFKERAELMVDAAGATGMLADGPETPDFLLSPSMSLRGGTDEVQRNILGERVLGLPGDTRLDRDVPWTKSRRGLL